MLVGKVHSIGILQPGDGLGDVLNLEICLEQLDVQHLAFGRVPAIGAHQVERQVAVVRFDESLHQRRIHARIVRFGRAMGHQYNRLALPVHVYARPVLRMHPDQQPQAGNFQRPHR